MNWIKVGNQVESRAVAPEGQKYWPWWWSLDVLFKIYFRWRSSKGFVDHPSLFGSHQTPRVIVSSCPCSPEEGSVGSLKQVFYVPNCAVLKLPPHPSWFAFSFRGWKIQYVLLNVNESHANQLCPTLWVAVRWMQCQKHSFTQRKHPSPRSGTPLRKNIGEMCRDCSCPGEKDSMAASFHSFPEYKPSVWGTEGVASCDIDLEDFYLVYKIQLLGGTESNSLTSHSCSDAYGKWLAALWFDSQFGPPELEASMAIAVEVPEWAEGLL